MHRTGYLLITMVVHLGAGRVRVVTIYRRQSLTEDEAREYAKKFVKDNPHLKTVINSSTWHQDAVHLDTV